MRVAMVGSGYVGLVSGACFADFGHHVSCIDNDTAKVAALQAGRIPIYEPGLEELVRSNVEAGRLSFSTDLAAGMEDAEVVFIAVATPARRSDGHADLAFVQAAAREIAVALKGYAVVATKSTVPVGTGDAIERIIRETRPDAEFGIVSNPEFLREGAAIQDFKRPDRILIGAEDERAAAVMRELYRPLYLNQAPIMVTGRRTAELTKYAANAFLATKVTFINEIADLCERVGANVQEVARGIGLDNRIGSKFLHAGPGFGGSCFPKDTSALVEMGREHGAPLRIVEAAASVNDSRKGRMARKIVDAAGGSVAGKRIAVLGLTFKPNTDDMRDAPAVAIVAALQAEGALIRAYDPKGMESARALLSEVEYAADAYDCAAGADVLAIVTEWDAFRALDLARIHRAMANPVIVDLRNIYRADEIARLGFAYSSVGRPDGAA